MPPPKAPACPPAGAPPLTLKYLVSWAWAVWLSANKHPASKPIARQLTIELHCIFISRLSFRFGRQRRWRHIQASRARLPLEWDGRRVVVMEAAKAGMYLATDSKIPPKFGNSND